MLTGASLDLSCAETDARYHNNRKPSRIFQGAHNKFWRKSNNKRFISGPPPSATSVHQFWSLASWVNGTGIVLCTKRPGCRAELSLPVSNRHLGSVTAEGLVEVNGQIEGELHCTSLVISRKAHVSGAITAEQVVVDGTVKCSIQGKDVVLKSQAHVVGDIQHQTLAIERVRTLKAAQCERVSQMSTGPGELVGGLLRKPQLRVGRIGSNSRDFCDGKEEAPWGETGLLRVPLGGTMMGRETHRRGAYHLYPIHGPGILPRVRSKWCFV